MSNLIITTPIELQGLISATIENTFPRLMDPLIKELIKEVSKDRILHSRRVGRREAARIEGICISMLDKMCRQGKYTRIKAGKKTLFDVDKNGRVI